MIMSGMVFATFENFWILLLAAISGVLSVTGGDFGPFRSIEECVHDEFHNANTDLEQIHLVSVDDPVDKVGRSGVVRHNFYPGLEHRKRVVREAPALAGEPRRMDHH